MGKTRERGHGEVIIGSNTVNYISVSDSITSNYFANFGTLEIFSKAAMLCVVDSGCLSLYRPISKMTIDALKIVMVVYFMLGVVHVLAHRQAKPNLY